MTIYTKIGDSGKTSVFSRKKLWKDDLKIEACGNLDELNASLGMIFSLQSPKKIKQLILKIQNIIFLIATEIANKKFTQVVRARLIGEIKWLEQNIDLYDGKLKPIRNFIFPVGTILSCHFHLARTICRRVERRLVTLFKKKKIPQEVIIYLNRLSDLLFVLARFCNLLKNHKDITWQGSALTKLTKR